ncbi:MAG: hypothetical protein ACXWLR_14745, partial [Myxococcales bacterium]
NDGNAAAVFGNVDPQTALGTYARLDLHSGVLTGLLQRAKPAGFYTGSPWIAIAQNGTPAFNTVLRLDLGTNVALCAATDSSLISPYPNDVIACTTGAPGGPQTLTSYAVVTGAVRTLSVNMLGYSGPSFLSPHVAMWQESDGVHFVRIDSAADPRLLCSGAYQPAVSVNEAVAVAACGAALTVYDLVSGQQSVAATIPGTVSSVAVTPAARAIAVAYAPGTLPGAYACGASQTWCVAVIDRTTGLIATSPNTFGSGVSIAAAAPGDAGFLLNTSGTLHVHLADAGPRISPVSQLFYYSTPPVWGAGGRCALLATQLSDADAGTVVPVSLAAAPTRLGASEDWLAGDTVFHLADCTSQALGTAIAVLGTSPAGTLVYRDPASAALLRYAPGTGVTQLAAKTALLGWSSYGYPVPGPIHNPLVVLTSVLDAQLLDVLPDGTVRTLLAAASPRLTQLSARWAMAYAHPDLTTGDAVLIDMDAGAAVALAARASFDGPSFGFTSVVGSRVVFNGWPASAGSGPQQLLVANVDGTDLRVVGDPGGVLSTVGARLVFTSGGLTRIEGRPSGPSIAIDSAVTGLTASPDGASVVFGGSVRHPGTYRLALP